MTTEDFKHGDRVKYIPPHAKGDVNHPECCSGVVKRTNEAYVFVNYIQNGILQETAHATRPGDLIHELS